MNPNPPHWTTMTIEDAIEQAVIADNVRKYIARRTRITTTK